MAMMNALYPAGISPQSVDISTWLSNPTRYLIRSFLLYNEILNFNFLNAPKYYECDDADRKKNI